MKFEEIKGKSVDTIIEEYLNSNDLNKKDILYTSNEEQGGLFKSASFTVKIITIKALSEYLVEFLEDLTRNMNLEVKFETKIKDEQITIKMSSDNNSILIGKNGKTLVAIQTILRQLVFNNINKYPYIILDVEDYKEKQQQNLERMAKRIAKEVISTKIDVTLDSMNSFERRIVHNALNDIKEIETTSTGEEPNRCVVIKYKG